MSGSPLTSTHRPHKKTLSFILHLWRNKINIFFHFYCLPFLLLPFLKSLPHYFFISLRNTLFNIGIVPSPLQHCRFYRFFFFFNAWQATNLFLLNLQTSHPPTTTTIHQLRSPHPSTTTPHPPCGNHANFFWLILLHIFLPSNNPCQGVRY